MSNRPPAFQLAEYLQAQGYGTLGTDLFATKEPATPDNVTTLYDTGGEPPLLYDEPLKVPTIQVRVRDFDYGSAYAKHQSAFAILNQVLNQTIDGNYYVGVWSSSEILNLGYDESERVILTANYRIERQ